MSRFKSVIPIVIITFLAGLIRFYQLSHFPIGFTADEASHGYDAFSLLQTGKDQWGNSWPLAFHSFGDWKLPVYSYLSIIPISIAGLSIWSTRFIGALVGTLAVPATYYATKELSRTSKQMVFQYLPIWSAIVLAISPWHIQLSRGAYEANLTSFFMPLALLFTLRGIRKFSSRLNWDWFIASSFLAINLYTYHAARLATVLVGISLIVYAWYRLKDIPQMAKAAIPAITLMILCCLPIATSLVNGGGSRAWDVAVFNPTDHWTALADTRHQLIINHVPAPIARIIHNKATYTTQKIIQNYITYLSPSYLIFNGASESTYGMISGTGVIYLVSFVFFLIAIGHSIKRPSASIILIWAMLLVSIIPAAISKGNGFAANRAATMMPWIQITSAYGISATLAWMSKYTPRIQLTYQGIIIGIYCLSFVLFASHYYIRAPYSMAPAMSYGWQQVIPELNQGSPSHIYLDRDFTEPQIFPLFFNQIDPTTIQDQVAGWIVYQEQGFSFVDMLSEYSFGNYTIKDVEPHDLQPGDYAVIPYNSVLQLSEQDVIIYMPAYPEPQARMIILKR